LPSDLEQALAAVRIAAFDVDGVLTDGGIWLDEEGRDRTRYHVRDGLGLRLLQKEGIEVVFLSGRRSAIVQARAEILDVRHALSGVKDKLAALREIAGARDAGLEEVLFLGDDLVDLPVMARVGVPAAVADAVPEVLERAALVTRAPGGHGATREVAERLLRARGRWEAAIAPYTG